MNKNRIVRYILIAIFIVLLILILTGYFAVVNEAAEIKSYLAEKYGSSFTIESLDSHEWTSDTRRYICKDIAGKQFSVQLTKQYLTDNYQSLLFDCAAGEHFTDNLPFYCKAFVSTANQFFDKNGRYYQLDSYLHACSTVNLLVCTADSTLDAAYVKETLRSIAKENAVDLDVSFYSVTIHEYKKISSYSRFLHTPGNIVLHGYLTIGADGNIISDSWE